ncbi:MAG: cysteine--tRNA ligase [Candidatus Saccharimonadales bacterium]
MRLYNGLTKHQQQLEPLSETVRIYSCGPTVYDQAHIGNLAAYIFADSLRRAISAEGHQVLHVMNYTDVDDKIIARSAKNYPQLEPDQALTELTSKYIAQFNDDMVAIGNQLEAYKFIKATDSIEEMKQLIIELHKAGFAYLADDGVYFSIAKYRQSGKVYGQLSTITDSSTSEARIQNDEYDKATPHDFALWKKQKPGEPAWPLSIDGQDLSGRPGWHIECSAMSQKQLGIPFDIHTGGIDLIFPHHENEIAQSTALHKGPIMAGIFAHNNHVLVDGRKMAKSANNFYTLADIAAKGFEPLALRLMILQTHYRREAHFSWQNLEAAQNRLNNWRATADLVWQANPQMTDIPAISWQEAALQPVMSDNLDTPRAIFLIDQLFGQWNGGISTQDAQQLRQYLISVDSYLGLNLSTTTKLSQESQKLLDERHTARVAEDWATADKLRNQLLKADVEVRDTPQGQIWNHRR